MNNNLDSSTQQQLQSQLAQSMKMRGVPNIRPVTQAKESGTISCMLENALSDDDRKVGKTIQEQLSEECSRQMAKHIDAKILLKMNEDPKSGYYHCLTFQKRQELIDKINYLEGKYLDETPDKYK